MKKIYCDKCGKRLLKPYDSLLIPREVFRFARGGVGNIKLAMVKNIEIHDTDLCINCYKALAYSFPTLSEEDIND